MTVGFVGGFEISGLKMRASRAQVFNYRDAQWGLDLLCTLAADLDRAAVRGNAAPAVLVAEAREAARAASEARVFTAEASGAVHLGRHVPRAPRALPARRS